MNKLVSRGVLLASILALSSALAAQERGGSPFLAYDCAEEVSRHESTRGINQYVRAIASHDQLPDLAALKEMPCPPIVAGRDAGIRRANWFLFVAELMRRIGDYRASDYYQLATEADPNEAAHHLFFGDYLRNFRGPGEPLFPRAERQYFLGQSVLRRIGLARAHGAALFRQWDDDVANRIARSLVALHQRDGIPLASRGGDIPALFLASVFRTAKSSADLDDTSDVRDYTAAAALAQSRQSSPLGHDQLRSMIRTEAPIDTFTRLRLRYGAAPVVDLFYDYRHTDNAAITAYAPPFAFNSLQLNSWGATIEKPFTFSHAVDVSVEGSVQQVWRKGLIEYVPHGLERIRQFQGRVALSKYVGRDRLNVSATYVHQAINPDVAKEPNRERRLLAPTVSYQFFRPSTFGEHFETRGIELFGGALLDRETYPVAPSNGADTVIRRRDYFVGIAARGLDGGRWDLTLQPTFFSSAVKPDLSQNNSQYRTNFVALFRIFDEEKHPTVPDYGSGSPRAHLAFLHLVFPVSDDLPREGITAFRNYKGGIELDSMWYMTKSSGISFLGSVRYDFQRFYSLNKDQHLVAVTLSMGF